MTIEQVLTLFQASIIHLVNHRDSEGLRQLILASNKLLVSAVFCIKRDQDFMLMTDDSDKRHGWESAVKDIDGDKE